MGVRSNQIFLDEPLSYEAAVSVVSANELSDKDRADALIDEAQYRYYDVPSGQIDGIADTFTIPEAASAVLAARNGKKYKESELTLVTTTSVELPETPLVGDVVRIFYLPLVGVASGHDGRLSVSYISTTTILTRAQVTGKLLIVDTSGGQVTLTLPTMLDEDEGVRVAIKRKGANNLLVDAGSGDSIGCVSQKVIDVDRGSLDLLYVRRIKDWFLKGVANATQTGSVLDPVPSATTPLFSYVEED